MIKLTLKLMSIVVTFQLIAHCQQSMEIRDFRVDPVELLKVRPDEEIKELRVNLSARDEPLGRIIYLLAFQTDVQFGMEILDLDRDRFDYGFSPYLHVFKGPKDDQYLISEVPPETYWEAQKMSIEATNRRLEDVLNDLVGAMKRYRWEIKDGIVNILPKENRNPQVLKFLDIQIRSFTLPAGKTIHPLIDAVREQAEVKNSQFQIVNNGKGTQGFVKKFVLKEQIEFSNLSLRSLLNRLARINRCGWFVSSNGIEKEGNSEVIIVLGI